MTLLQSLITFFIGPILALIFYVLIIYMIFSWLLAFNIVNLRNPIMRQIYDVVRSITEPILNPVRRFVPPIGGLDMAFLVVILVLFWLRGFVLPMLYNLVG